jgi:formate hydrogenlyase subunit 4
MFNLILNFFLIIIVAFGSVCLGLFFKGIDRILNAKIQKRVGPPLLQPFYDLRKLMVKESIIPKNASKRIFEIAPLISLVSSILILLYTPIAGKSILGGSGDLILIVYLFVFPGLSLVLGSFASNSPYAHIGGQRMIINMLGYEFPLVVASLAPVWIVHVNGSLNIFSLETIYNNNIWSLVGPIGIIGLLIEVIVVFLVIAGELSKTPFDIESAGSEIAGGALAEYSGRNLAMFYLAEAVKIIAIASLFNALFFAWNVDANFGIQFLIYIFKLFLISFVGLTVIRTITSRFKISRLTRSYWGYIGLLAILGFLFIL